MKKIFDSFNIKLSEKQLEQFEKYYEILIDYNEKFNITAITEKEEVIVKHFVDSILGVDKIKGYSLIDVGSGGGFPAIPIKIMKPEIKLSLLEATGKKCEFLKAVIRELNLENVEVINNRAETLAKVNLYRESFDVCTARAVARLNTLLEYCMPFVKVGGEFVAYKGDAVEEVKEAENAVKVLGGKIIEVEKYSLLDAKRTLVVVKKEKQTDKKYPRGNGKERKNPL